MKVSLYEGLLYASVYGPILVPIPAGNLKQHPITDREAGGIVFSFHKARIRVSTVPDTTGRYQMLYTGAVQAT